MLVVILNSCEKVKEENSVLYKKNSKEVHFLVWTFVEKSHK